MLKRIREVRDKTDRLAQQLDHHITFAQNRHRETELLVRGVVEAIGRQDRERAERADQLVREVLGSARPASPEAAVAEDLQRLWRRPTPDETPEEADARAPPRTRYARLTADEEFGE